MTTPNDFRPGDVVRNEGYQKIKPEYVLLCVARIGGKCMFINRYCVPFTFTDGFKELRLVGHVDLTPWRKEIQQAGEPAREKI